VLRALDDLHLAHLRLDVPGPEAAVDDADAPFFRLHDGHRRARDRVHVGRHDGTAERQMLRDAAREVDRRRIAARDDALLRRQQKIVECGAVDEPGHHLRRLHFDTGKILASHPAIVTRLTRGS
jgi:hypothetical protein